MKFKEFFEGSQFMKLYRGQNAYQQGGGHYWSTDREWARQFTQSGLDSEIKEKVVLERDIMVLNPLPHATDEAQISNAAKMAMNAGYKGFKVDEGKGQPNSVFML